VQTSRVRPETRYVRSGDIHIAYQVVGTGPLDLVYVAEFWHSIEAQWEEPAFERFLRRLASFSRLICFDQRGTGLSDPVALSELPSLEQWMDDVRAVMEAAGCPKAALLSSGGGGLMSMLFAATYPDRTHSLVLLNPFARLTRTEDYPWGTSPEFEDRVVEEMRIGWGRGVLLDLVAPSMEGDPQFHDWWARYQRLGSSPGTILVLRRMLEQVDVRHVLPAIRVPTLILHRANNRLVVVDHGRYIAERILGARYLEAPGIDYFPFLGNADVILNEIEEFLTGSRHEAELDRVLATVMFIDIVGSTELAARIGDYEWKGVLDGYRVLVRGELERFRGKEVDTTGDGFLATFDGPARAIRCACAVREGVRRLGLGIRAGLHTGEIELLGDDVGGIAVHIGARVISLAGPGEVLVSSTVKDLVAGAGIDFEDRGVQALKGVPGEWRLFSVAVLERR
jgi:class 3 adenylate cyclase/pimeloyl-ACP methyl ester carboxylesterase